MTVGSPKRRLARNAAINWAGTLAQMVAVFFVAPILVRGLGDVRYGVWTLIESILAYLTLFDLGIGAAVVRYIARFEGVQDLRGINRTFSASVCLFAMAGLGVLAVASLLLGPAWGWIPVPSEHRDDAWWLLSCLSFNLAFGLPMGVFAAVLDGLQRYGPKTSVRMVALVIRSLAMVTVVRIGGGLAAIALTVTVIAMVEHLLLALLAFTFLPGLRFSPRSVDRDAIRMIGGYSANAFVAMVAGRISFQTDAIVIGAWLNPGFITYFALASRLVEYGKTMFRSFTTVLTPAISHLEGKDATSEIQTLWLKATRYALWIAFPLELGLLLLGVPFLSLWIGPDHGPLAGPTLKILALPLVLVVAQFVSARVLYGTGRLKPFTAVVTAEALLNLLLSLLLVGRLGIVGVALGTSLPNIVSNLIVIGIARRFLRVSLFDYVRRCWMGPASVALLPASFWLAAIAFINDWDWGKLLVVGVVGLLIHCVGFGLLEFGAARISAAVRSMIQQFNIFKILYHESI